ncbi:hypothetical protein GCM10010376_09220 [Streptomyces violaceusniger]
MPAQQGVRGQTHRLGIQRSFDFQNQLHGIDVVRCLVIYRVEQQTLLQRGQWKNVLDPRPIHVNNSHSICAQDIRARIQ